MPAALNPPSDPAASARSRRLKWGVYSLLFLDFLLYFAQDAESAKYTLSANPALPEWARAFATSIDLAAWFVLILFFELETGAFRERMRTRAPRRCVQGVRAICYVGILHTTVTDLAILREFYVPHALPAADLCAYADGAWSFLENRGYTTIDAHNCAALGAGPAWFAIGMDQVIVDAARLREGLILAWTDVVENLAWLTIVAIDEALVRIQGRGAASAKLVGSAGYVKGTLYVLILGIALYWGAKGQILYLWDEILWIAGFALIDRNILEWRAGALEARRMPHQTPT